MSRYKWQQLSHPFIHSISIKKMYKYIYNNVYMKTMYEPQVLVTQWVCKITALSWVGVYPYPVWVHFVRVKVWCVKIQPTGYPW